MNLKKMLALLLAAIMLLGVFPITALAEGDEPTEDPAAVTDTTEPEDSADATDPADNSFEGSTNKRRDQKRVSRLRMENYFRIRRNRKSLMNLITKMILWML